MFPSGTLTPTHPWEMNLCVLLSPRLPDSHHGSHFCKCQLRDCQMPRWRSRPGSCSSAKPTHVLPPVHGASWQGPVANGSGGRIPGIVQIHKTERRSTDDVVRSDTVLTASVQHRYFSDSDWDANNELFSANISPSNREIPA